MPCPIILLVLKPNISFCTFEGKLPISTSKFVLTKNTFKGYDFNVDTKVYCGHWWPELHLIFVFLPEFFQEFKN